MSRDVIRFDLSDRWQGSGPPTPTPTHHFENNFHYVPLMSIFHSSLQNCLNLDTIQFSSGHSTRKVKHWFSTQYYWLTIYMTNVQNLSNKVILRVAIKHIRIKTDDL